MATRGNKGTRRVPLLQCVREVNAMINLLDLFCEYINPLPGMSFFPNLEVHPWLRRIIWERGRQQGERQACLELVDNLQKERVEYQKCMAWFRGLKAENGFYFDENDLVFGGEWFKNVTQRPTKFFHRWMEDMENRGIQADDQRLREKLVESVRERIVQEFVRQ